MDIQSNNAALYSTFSGLALWRPRNGRSSISQETPAGRSVATLSFIFVIQTADSSKLLAVRSEHMLYYY